MKATPHPDQLSLFADHSNSRMADPLGNAKGGRGPAPGSAPPEKTVSPPREEPQTEGSPPTLPDLNRPALTVAELEAEIAALDAAIAPLAKQRSELLRKRRPLAAAAASSKVRKAKAVSSAQVKELRAKHGPGFKAVKKIAQQVKRHPRTVYRVLERT